MCKRDIFIIYGDSAGGKCDREVFAVRHPVACFAVKCMHYAAAAASARLANQLPSSKFAVMKA